MPEFRGVLRPKDDVSRRLGDQFRRLREMRGVSLRALSEAIGHGRHGFFLIRRHEAGTVMLRADDLFKAAKHLRVRPAELLYIGDEDGE